jgi:acyl carrier protein
MDKFYAKLSEILEAESVKREDVLRDFDCWDSLTALAIIAMIDADFGINLTVEKLRELSTAGDLEDYIKSQKA